MTTVSDGLFQYGGSPVATAGPFPRTSIGGRAWFVDGTNGSDGYTGKTPRRPFATIQAAVDSAVAGDTIYVFPMAMVAGASDPGSYEENVVIPATTENLTLIGVNYGRTQGGLPQLKVGATTTQALLTIQAAGCHIVNMGFNGVGATGGGILLDDDGSTKSAFGTTIESCHFKNCKGTTATNAATGGAIQWSANGGAWQVLIKGNRFYKNVGDVVLLGTGVSVPQDVVIEDNLFSGPAASVDCNLYLMGGSGMTGLAIRNNTFAELPAVGSGTNVRYIKATGCGGVMDGNRFACTGLTFNATTGTGALIPATLFMAANYQEKATSGSGEIVRA